MITNHGKGNPELVNLPRKINIGLATTRDDFAHTHINDVGLYAAKDPETGKVHPPPFRASPCASSSLCLRLSLVQSVHADDFCVNLHNHCMPMGFLCACSIFTGVPSTMPAQQSCCVRELSAAYMYVTPQVNRHTKMMV